MPVFPRIATKVKVLVPRNRLGLARDSPVGTGSVERGIQVSVSWITVWCHFLDGKTFCQEYQLGHIDVSMEPQYAYPFLLCCRVDSSMLRVTWCTFKERSKVQEQSRKIFK